MFIPGFLIAWLTFPGVIVHELAHAVFCQLFKVDIFEIKYFQFAMWGKPSGYVIHGHPNNLKQGVWIGIGPFVVNTVLGGLIGAPAAIPVIILGSRDPLTLVLFWLGLSIAMHAFPSRGDAASILQQANQMTDAKPPIWVKLIVGAIRLMGIASIVWADLIWGVLVVAGIPYLIIKLLAMI